MICSLGGHHLRVWLQLLVELGKKSSQESLEQLSKQEVVSLKAPAISDISKKIKLKPTIVTKKPSALILSPTGLKEVVKVKEVPPKLVDGIKEKLKTSQVSDTKLREIIKQSQLSSQESLIKSLNEQNVRVDILQKSSVQQKQATKLKTVLSEKEALRSKATGKLSTAIKIPLKIPKPIIIPPLVRGVVKNRLLKETTPKKEQLFRAQAKDKGIWKNVSRKPLTRSDALSKSARAVDKSTSAQGRIVPTAKRGRRTTFADPYFTNTRNKYRTFKIVKGKRVPLKNQFIEHRRSRIDTISEQKQLSLAKFLKQKQQRLFPKRKPFKIKKQT